MKKWSGCMLLLYIAQTTLAPVATASLRASHPVQIPSYVAETVLQNNLVNSARTVYHIQDLHEQIEPQINLAETISLLEKNAAERKKYVVVAVEGTSGEIDIESITRTADQKSCETVASGLLKAGYLFGEEYAALTHSPGAIKIVGIEASDLYEKNFRAKQNSQIARTTVARHLKELHRQLLALIDHNFNATLAELEKKRIKFEEGKISLIDYAVFLGSQELIEKKLSPALQNLIEVASTERHLNFSQVDKEREAILSTLMAVATPAEKRERMKEAVAFREGRISALSYYTHLIKISPIACPTITRYLAYLKRVDGLNSDLIFNEINALADKISQRHLKHPLSKALYEDIRWVEQQIRFFELDMMPNEWEEQRAIRAENMIEEVGHIQGFVAEQVQDLGYSFPTIAFNEDDFRNAIKGARDFYLIAEARNVALVENLYDVLKLHPVGKADVVLIAGGFHTPALIRLLEAKNISTVVLRPQAEAAVSLPDGIEYPPYVSVKRIKQADYLRPPGGLATSPDFVASLVADPYHQPAPSDWPVRLGAERPRSSVQTRISPRTLWHWLSNAIPGLRIFGAPVTRAGTSYVSDAIDSLTTMMGDNETQFSHQFSRLLSQARPAVVNDPSYVIIDVDSVGFDLFLNQSQQWERFFVSLSARAALSSGAKGVVVFSSNRSDARSRLEPLVTSLNKKAEGISFSFSAAGVGRIQMEGMTKTNTYVLSTSEMVYKNAQSVVIRGIPHLAVAAFAFSHYKDGASILEGLSALLEAWTPLRMNGTLTDRIMAVVLAQISA